MRRPEGLPWFTGFTADEAPPPAPQGEPADPALPPGRLRDEGLIARGGMASIHRVYDSHLRRRVALKMLDPALADDPDLARRFVGEARLTSALDHPGIVPVHDLMGTDARSACYTMRLVQGHTLGELIERQATRRDLEQILGCVATVCDVLSYVHSRGIVHRDVKPDNILVGDHGEVYLLDWGCALQVRTGREVSGSVEAEGTVAGTVRYMAPEQARGEIAAIGPWSDVFSVGAVLYKALSGVSPYPGPTIDALACARGGAYRPLDDFNGVTVKPPPMLIAIVARAMAVDPSARHPSAAALAADLRDFLRGGDWFPLHVFPPGFPIVHEGDWADAAYIVHKGRCEVRQRDPADPQGHRVLRVLQPGDVFGETAIFAGVPRSASVVALDEVHAVVLDRDSLEQLAGSTYLGRFVQALAGRFLEVEARLRSR